MKDEYSAAADQMKQMLVAEYVRTHPEVSASEVVVRSVNGRAVCDTLTNIMAQSGGGQQAKKKSLDLDTLRIHMEVSENERYQACLTSVQSCEKLIDFLIGSIHSAFGDVEKRDNLEFLDRWKRLCAVRAQTVQYIKKSFIQMMDGVTPPIPAKIKSEAIAYLRALMDQLKAQGAVFKREFDLGNDFCSCLIAQMKEMLPKVKSELSGGTKTNTARAFATLKLEQAKEVELPKANLEALESSLESMQGHLRKRRIQFEAIEKIIAFLEELVERIERAREAEKPPEKKKDEAPGRRMAFMSKLLGGKRGK